MVEFPLLLVCNVSFLECIHLICTISCYILRLPQSAGIVSAARQVDGFRRFPKPCKEPPKQGLLSKETCPALSFIIPHVFQPLCFAKKKWQSQTLPPHPIQQFRNSTFLPKISGQWVSSIRLVIHIWFWPYSCHGTNFSGMQFCTSLSFPRLGLVDLRAQKEILHATDATTFRWVLEAALRIADRPANPDLWAVAGVGKSGGAEDRWASDAQHEGDEDCSWWEALDASNRVEKVQKPLLSSLCESHFLQFARSF